MIKSSEITDYQNLNDSVDYRNNYLPESIAFRFITDTDEEELLTSKQFYNEVVKLTNLLLEYTRPGDRIILAAQPGLEFIISFFACMRAGTIAVPVFPPANAQMAIRLLHIIDDAKPSVILSDKAVVSSLKKGLLAHRFLPKSLKKIIGIEEAYTSLFAVFKTVKLPLVVTDQRKNYSTVLPPLNPLNKSDIACLQYTSGSTANPRGVILTHGNLLDNIMIMKNATAQPKNAHLFSWLPPYHDMGIMGSILYPFHANFNTTLMSPQHFIKDPVSWVKYISKYRCTITGGPNFAYELCARRITDDLLNELDLSCLCAAVNSAEPISAKTLELFYDRFKHAKLPRYAIYPAYGLAEATLLVSAKVPLAEDKMIRVEIEALGSNRVKLDLNPDTSLELVSSGQPRMDVQIINPVTHTPCKSDEVGEIWVHGESVGLGYFNNEEDTKRVFKNQIHGASEQRYYLKTGDLGFLYQGDLFVCGRSKDIIIINGQNYYPQDFEWMVMSSNSCIKKGNVIAFADLSTTGREQLSIVAEVLPDTKKEDYAKIVVDIQKALSQAFYLNAQNVYLVAKRSIPKTTSGKLQRSKCAELIRFKKINFLYSFHAQVDESNRKNSPLWINELLQTSETDRKNQLIQHIKKMITQVLHLPDEEKIDSQTSLFELGIDSLNALNLSDKLKEQLSLEISLSELFRHHTVDDLADFLLLKITSTTASQNPINATTLANEINQGYDCSLTQESILNQYLINKEIAQYNMYTTVLFDKNTSIETILNLAKEFIKNNDSLSIIFAKTAKGYQQLYVSQIDYDNCIQVIKLKKSDSREQILRSAVLKPFELLGGLLFRIIIMQYRTGEHEVLFIVNHIISDTQSMIIAQYELTHYPKIKPQLTQASFNTMQRQLYAEQIKGINQLKEVRLQQFNGLKAMTLHHHHQQNELFTNQEFILCSKESMNMLINNYHTTGFIVCLAITSLILNGLSLNEKIPLLVPLSKRKNHKDENQQGFFINNLLLNPNINWELKFNHWCTLIQEEFLDAQEHHYPLEQLLIDLVKEKNIEVNLPVATGFLGDYADVSLAKIGATNMGLDLMIYFAINRNSQWTMHINYLEQVFPEEVIYAMGSCFKSMLTQALNNPNILNCDLYASFAAEKSLEDYAMLLHPHPIAVKTNIESDIVGDLLNLFFEPRTDLSLNITKDVQDSLFTVSALDKKQLKIVIMDIDVYINSEHFPEHIMQQLEDGMKRLYATNSSAFLGIIGTRNAVNLVDSSKMLDNLSALKIKNRFFLQTVESDSSYDLSLIELLKTMIPYIKDTIEGN